MGNMGFSQNLPALVEAFECSPDLNGEVRLILAGTGELARAVAAEIRTDRVEMPGLLLDELEIEMEQATIGLVPQRPDVDEFNLPSKLMNLMSGGVPVLASVNPSSEVARIVRESGAGWVVDAVGSRRVPARASATSWPTGRSSRGEAPPGWSSPGETSAPRSSRPGSRTSSTRSPRATAWPGA